MDQATVIYQRTASTDAELAVRLRRGDAAAFRTLMQRYNQRLFRMARGVLGDSADAEDAVQEAYVLAFTHIDQFREAASLVTWLSRIVLNEAFRRLRQRKDMTALDDGDDSFGDDSFGKARIAQVIPFPGAQGPSTPEEDAARAEIRRVLERAIDNLPDMFRVVFVLREIEQMSVEETATCLAIPTDTVKTRLHRARRLLGRSLRQQLSPNLTGVFPFAGERCSRIVTRVLERLGLPEHSAEA
jgi:RNA polymerase sigma-70 factor (ECF subfamily)